jgi:hypothetical protein
MLVNLKSENCCGEKKKFLRWNLPWRWQRKTSESSNSFWKRQDINTCFQNMKVTTPSPIETGSTFIHISFCISDMHWFYDEGFNEKRLQLRDEDFYGKTFVEEFNLTFHKPKNYAYDKCDKCAIVMKTVSDQETCLQLQRRKDELEISRICL